MINKRSNHLVVLIATYNRLESLKRSVRSITAGTRCVHEIIVIDGGSTDGTVEYLNAQNEVTAVFQGRLLGASRAYNRVWRQVESEYTCWLSDDTQIVPGALDLAVQILKNDHKIGMVGLKTKDVIGPWAANPYQGALSFYGILNCNHAVLPLSLLRSVGYFNEDYPTYMIDPDLTASVLSTGKKVVMTKSICVLHYRAWAEHGEGTKIKDSLKGIDHNRIYNEKFAYLASRTLQDKIRTRIVRALCLPWISRLLPRLFGLNARDWLNLTGGRFISVLDPLRCMRRSYHNVQSIPRAALVRERNPYRSLLQESI